MLGSAYPCCIVGFGAVVVVLLSLAAPREQRGKILLMALALFLSTVIGWVVMFILGQLR